MVQPAALLRLLQISKCYEATEGGNRVFVLENIDLELSQGESLAIVGPSGSGKSTLLNIIGTLDQPSHGQVHLAGEDLTHLDEERLAQVRNRRIGFVFQAHHLLPQCSVLENVLVPTLPLSSQERGGTEERARELLKRVGLSERIWHRPGQLSGGERQRVAVVRALINQPQLLLADEPTGALDRVAAQDLTKLLLELNREQKITLIVVTHSLELAAKMQRTVELQNGRLMAAKH